MSQIFRMVLNIDAPQDQIDHVVSQFQDIGATAFYDTDTRSIVVTCDDDETRRALKDLLVIIPKVQ